MQMFVLSDNRTLETICKMRSRLLRTVKSKFKMQKVDIHVGFRLSC